VVICSIRVELTTAVVIICRIRVEITGAVHSVPYYVPLLSVIASFLRNTSVSVLTYFDSWPDVVKGD